MGKISFNVDAYTARLIGRQNVSSLEGGLLEIVKNSYDADASICMLYYEKSTNTLYIADNGYGMTDSCIKEHWMTIGNSSKTNKFITNRGRIQTGAKGIGRFALDRIASNCHMLTKTKDSSYEWIVNWELFTSHRNITEIYADLSESQKNFDIFMSNIKNIAVKNMTKKYFFHTGTVFKLTNLRDNWSKTLINKIRNKLSTAIPPGNKNNFRILLFEEDTKLEDAEIRSEYVDNYDYKVSFLISENGFSEIRIHRNEFDFRGKFDYIIEKGQFNNDDREYFKGKKIVFKKHISELISIPQDYDFSRIGKFWGELYFYKKSFTRNDKEKFYYKDISKRQKMKERFGGIKIYRDNFRVRPYGESDSSSYDWLNLDNRKAKSPASPTHETGKWRVSSEQMIGQIYISRLNVYFEDQANREGIVETQEFIYFKEIIVEIISLLENDRQYVLRKLGKLYDMEHDAKKYEKEIKERIKLRKENKEINKAKKDEITNRYSNSIEIDKVNIVIEKKDEEIKNLEDENRMLRALATTGIIANTYMHEMRSITHKLGTSLRLAQLYLEKNKVGKAYEHIRESREYRKKFNEWFKVTIESVRKDRRTMRKNNINILIKNLVNSWEKVISNNKQIKFIVNELAEVSIKCFPFEIESIINNLIANSISAYEKCLNNNDSFKIKITIDESDFESFIIYEDNGPGLSKKYKKNPYKILEPFETDKIDENGELMGTGIGIWIIDKTINEYNGRLDLSPNINKGNGFYLKIIFSKRKQ